MTPLVPLSELELFAQGLDHAEGICLAPDGLLYVGGESGQLYRVEEDGVVTEVLRTGGFSLGLAADAESNIYLCDQVHHCVWKINPGTGERRVFSRGNAQTPMRAPNWGCFDDAGNYYVSDSGGWGAADGVIWKVHLGGRTEIWTDECRDFPNGMCLSADGSTLFVLESVPPALVAIGIEPDGSAGHRRVIAELPGTVPDGIALTDDGRFVIACYRPDALYLVDQEGRYEVIAADPQGTVLAAPTNVVFAGSRLDELIVPNFNRWHLARLSVLGLIGLPLRYPAAAPLQQNVQPNQ